MRALKINFGGRGAVSVDWGSEISGGDAVAQKAGVSVMTRLGSDKFLPSRGTRVTEAVLSYGVFDLLSMQHTLNFGALKARDDMVGFEGDREAVDSVGTIRMSLLDVENNFAQVGVDVTTAAGQSTRVITEIA